MEYIGLEERSLDVVELEFDLDDGGDEAAEEDVEQDEDEQNIMDVDKSAKW